MSLPISSLLPLVIEKLQGLLGPLRPVQATCDASLLTIGAHSFRLLVLPEPVAAWTGPGLGSQLREPTIAVAAYIPQQVGRRLRQQGQHYADAMGNAWLEAGAGPTGWLLLAEGARSRRLKPILDAAFQPHGLRLLTHLLGEPSLVQQPEATLARLVRVPLPAVVAALRSLQDAGFLSEAGGARRLVELPALAVRWAARYGTSLYPYLPKQQYQWQPSRHDRLAWVSLARKTRTLLGGALAARRLLGLELLSNSPTLYTHAPAAAGLLRQAGLEPHPAGPVELIRLFTVPAAFPGDYCVHPLLIYADLLRAGGDTSQQVARLLLRRYLPHLAG